MKTNHYISILIISICLMLTSCVNYYYQTAKFNLAVQTGNFVSAEAAIKSKGRWKKNHNRLLNFMNLGRVAALQGNVAESNEMFEKAYLQIEDYNKSFKDYTLQLLINSTKTVYLGEEHEKLYVHYFKILNFFKLGNVENALVEVRRLNIKLNKLDDKYSSDKKFQRDAFLFNVMGIVYQAAGEWNNAYIAYKKAYDIYRLDYAVFFSIPVPEQLKQDLLRASNVLGFTTEQAFLEKEMGIKYVAPKESKSEVVVFWENGLVPIKDEVVIFFNLSMQGNNLLFVNSMYNLNFSVPYTASQFQSNGLANVNLVSMAIPRSIIRKAEVKSVDIMYADKKYGFEMGDDLGAIAIKLLRDRAAKVMGQALLRIAIKQGLAYVARTQNQYLGAAVSVAGALTEHVDTRSWQSLPQTIAYRRIPVQNPSDSTLKFNINSETVTREQIINFKPVVNNTSIIQLTTTGVSGLEFVQ